MKQADTHFTSEIRYCIERQDAVKARALLQFFPEQDEPTRMRALFEIAKAEDRFGFPLLVFVAGLKVPETRVRRKLLDLLLDKALARPALLAEMLESPPNLEQIIPVRLVAETEARETRALLYALLSESKPEPLAREILRTLARLGDEHARVIGLFLFHESERLQMEAIAALSKIGNTAALELLAESVSGPPARDRKIVEAIAAIPSREAMERLVFFLHSAHSGARAAAIDALIELGDVALPLLLDHLGTSDDDATVHLLHVIGHTGSELALSAIRKFLFQQPADPNVRFAAYEAMERLPASRAAISLAAGLEDENAHVRLMAARAVNRHLSPVLQAGLRNLTAPDTKEARDIAALLLDAGAEAAVRSLAREAGFSAHARAHLTTNALPETRALFVEKFREWEMEALATAIEAVEPVEVRTSKRRILAVDDSKMMLRIYKGAILKMGHEAVLHEFPGEAWNTIRTSPPDLVITDLNMPGINGLELVAEIRKRFSPTELPVVMVTTQSDFVGDHSASSPTSTRSMELETHGIQKLLNKPFEEADLHRAIEELL